MPPDAVTLLWEVKLPDLNGVNIDAFWPFWPLDRAGEALWLGVDLDKMEGVAEHAALGELGTI